MRRNVDSFPSNTRVSFNGGLTGEPATAILISWATFPSLFSANSSAQRVKQVSISS